MAWQCNTRAAIEGRFTLEECLTCGKGPCTYVAASKHPPRTLVLSPFAGDYERNRAYAQDAMLDSLRRGEAPFLSHLLYPQVLIDGIEAEREMGLRCEHAWLAVAEQVVAYVDFGISSGMRKAIIAWGLRYFETPNPVQYRELAGPWSRS